MYGSMPVSHWEYEHRVGRALLFFFFFYAKGCCWTESRVIELVSSRSCFLCFPFLLLCFPVLGGYAGVIVSAKRPTWQFMSWPGIHVLMFWLQVVCNQRKSMKMAAIFLWSSLLILSFSVAEKEQRIALKFPPLIAVSVNSDANDVIGLIPVRVASTISITFHTKFISWYIPFF